MAILYMDSFDHYITLSDKGLVNVQSGGSPPATSTTFARTGTRSMNNGNDMRNGTYFTMTSNQSTVWQCVAFRFETPPSASDSTIMGFRDSGTIQIDVRLTAARTLRVTRNGTSLALGTTVLAPSTFYHFDFSAVVATGTSGSFTLKLNGAVELTGSSLNSAGSGNSFANEIMIGGAGQTLAGQWYWDDWVAGDNTGASNTSSPGDVKVETLYPTGAGNTTNLTPSTGSNWQNVDDTTPNSDTDYNSSATPGDKDTYVFGNLVTTAGSVRAIQPVIYARKDDAGTRTIAPVYRPTTSDTDGTSQNIAAGYLFYKEIKETNPDTASAWTISEVNASEFGVKIVA